MIHRAKRTPTGWTYRTIKIILGATCYAAIVDDIVRQESTLKGMKTLIDRLLDGPATL